MYLHLPDWFIQSPQRDMGRGGAHNNGVYTLPVGLYL